MKKKKSFQIMIMPLLYNHDPDLNEILLTQPHYQIKSNEI